MHKCNTPLSVVIGKGTVSNVLPIEHQLETLTEMLILHDLSQQGVWVPFWTPKPLKNKTQDTQKFCEEFLKMSISSKWLDLFISI